MINILFLGDNCVYIKFNLNVFGEIWYMVFDLIIYFRNEIINFLVFNC